MIETEELSKCPNCQTSVKNIMTSHKILTHDWVEFAQEYSSFEGEYLCTKCSKKIIERAQKKYKTIQREAKAKIEAYYSSFPVISITAPEDWKYQTLSIVTSRAAAGDLVKSTHIINALLGMKKSLFDIDGMTHTGERSCIEIMRQKCYALGGNAIVGIDVDYVSNVNRQYVCMTGTAISVKNLNENQLAADVAFKAFQPYIEVIDKLKRFAPNFK